MTLNQLHLLSLSFGLVAYFGLICFSVINLIRKITGRALLAGAVVTFLFLLALALTGDSLITMSLQMLVYFAWLVLALRAMGWGLHSYRTRPIGGLGLLGLCMIGLVVVGWLYLWLILPRNSAAAGSLTPILIVDLLLSVCGLVAIEQLARNVRPDLRWRLRYLTISFGIIFGFGLVHSALTLLSGTQLLPLNVAQPAVLGLAAPLLAIASLRNREQALSVNVSRDFVFQTGVLMTTGGGLLLFALAGYYAQLFGGDLASAIFLLTATIVLTGLVVVLGSSRVQSRLRRFISEHLYDQKHDYRHVWAQVSDRLTEPGSDFTLSQQAIRSVLEILDSQSGSIWRVSERGTLLPEAQVHTSWNRPFSPKLCAGLCEFFNEKVWVIDLQQPPEEFPEMLRAGLATDFPDMRYLIPLSVQNTFTGLIAVGQPTLAQQLSWEDYAILKLVARQSAGVLELQQAATELSNTKQLTAMNKLSTFLVHDLKTISAQLILLLKNADKHKNNPVFIDDMLLTVENAATKMQKLVTQFQAENVTPEAKVDLSELLNAVLKTFADQTPRPSLTINQPGSVKADASHLASVITHVIQNAVDATSASGSVAVCLDSEDDWIEIKVDDTGIGMNETFLKTQLFAPFESTKGVAGMGVGVYQTRDYLRSLGGDVEVTSTAGKGSSFVLRIPAMDDSE